MNNEIKDWLINLALMLTVIILAALPFDGVYRSVILVIATVISIEAVIRSVLTVDKYSNYSDRYNE